MKTIARFLIPRERETHKFNVGFVAELRPLHHTQYARMFIVIDEKSIDVLLTEEEARRIRSMIDATIMDIAHHEDICLKEAKQNDKQ